MKTSNLFSATFWLGSIFLLSSCDDHIFGISGEGETVEEFRTMEDFDALSVAIPGKVYLSQGPKEEIRIEAQENILDNMEIEVRNGRLSIGFDKTVWNHEEIYVYVSTPHIKEIHVSGSGAVEGQNLITSETLEVSVSGSGDVELEVETDELRSSVSGSGKIEYAGTAESQNIRVSGSGDVEAFELESQLAEIHISGSGKAKVHVEDELEAHVSGSGDIIYSGNPKVNSHISGSGKVKARD